MKYWVIQNLRAWIHEYVHSGVWKMVVRRVLRSPLIRYQLTLSLACSSFRLWVGCHQSQAFFSSSCHLFPELFYSVLNCVTLQKSSVEFRSVSKKAYWQLPGWRTKICSGPWSCNSPIVWASHASAFFLFMKNPQHYLTHSPTALCTIPIVINSILICFIYLLYWHIIVQTKGLTVPSCLLEKSSRNQIPNLFSSIYSWPGGWWRRRFGR